MRARFVTTVAIVFAALSFARAAHADDAGAPHRTKVTDVCEGCVASFAEGDAPAPLLVLLHGDWGQGAPELHAAWSKHAAPRGVALLSIACPRSLGCNGSFWKWNGDPSFVTRAIDALEKKHAIDRERMWIAGWSGGATYIGWHSQEMSRLFSATVFHGGGFAPHDRTCAPESSAAIFLTSDGNPLHRYVVELRDFRAGCKDPITWIFMRGVDHAAEWKSLDARGGEIMDLLATQKRVLATPIASASALPSASLPAPVAPPSSAPIVAAASSSPPSSPPSTPPPSGCGCAVVGARASHAVFVFASAFGLAIALAIARRHHRVRRRSARDRASER